MLTELLMARVSILAAISRLLKGERLAAGFALAFQQNVDRPSER
jgi:hypothetical protein